MHIRSGFSAHSSKKFLAAFHKGTRGRWVFAARRGAPSLVKRLCTVFTPWDVLRPLPVAPAHVRDSSYSREDICFQKVKHPDFGKTTQAGDMRASKLSRLLNRSICMTFFISVAVRKNMRVALALRMHAFYGYDTLVVVPCVTVALVFL